MFKKGQKVVKILHCAGFRTATIQTVAKVSKGVVHLEDYSITFDNQTGRETKPSFGGSNEIIPMDGE